VLGRKVVKAKENFFVFLQALAGLWKFDLVTVDELLLRCQSRFAGQGRAHFMEQWGHVLPGPIKTFVSPGAK
jgi:hypothetical protein